MKNFGIILLVVGIIMTVFTGFTVITRKEVVDLGSVEINKKEKTPILSVAPVAIAFFLGQHCRTARE